MTPRPARLLTLAPLALVAPALTSCGLFGGGGHLADALDVTPGGATQARFVDREAMAERLGVDDVETGSGDVETYLDAVVEDPVGGTDLGQYLSLMQDLPFSELDVVWSMTGVSDDLPFSIYRLDDDVDLDQVRDDLVDAGMSADEDDGRIDLSAEDPLDLVSTTGVVGDGYPQELVISGTTIDTDAHLLITGAARDDVAATLDDDEDSLTDAGAYEDVLDRAPDDVELVALDGAAGCDARLGRTSSPEAEAQAQAALPDGLGRPDRTALIVAGNDDGVAISGALQFADDGAASDDADAREAYLADGELLVTQQPVSDLFTAQVDPDGDTVRVGLSDVDDAAAAVRVGEEHDGFMACGPGA